MDNDKVKDILLKKWEKKELANFYIIKNIEHSKDFSISWINNFLSQIYPNAKSNHPDILFLHPSEGKNYKTSDFNNFNTFISFKHFEFPWRFIIIQDAELIGEMLSNKLLKIIEAPPERTTIFYLYNSSRKLIPTIQSRGIDLFLSNHSSMTIFKELNTVSDIILWAKDNVHSTENEAYQLSPDVFEAFFNFLEHESLLPQLLNSLKKNKQDQKILSKILIDIESQKKSSYTLKSTFLQAVKWFEESLLFNNSCEERFLKLFYFTKRFCDEH